MSFAAVQKHVAVLERAGLVVKRRDGRQQMASGDVTAVRSVAAMLADIEQIWGPPEFPATFVDHDFTPGGRSTYYMTGPDGEKFGGWWQFQSIDPTSSFTFSDGFADADLNPAEDMPVSTNRYAFEATAHGTRAVYTATFASADDLQKVLEMGVVEGATASINQIDGLLAS